MRIAFSNCVLDTDTRELLRSGEVVHLSPKAFRLLEVLLEKRPQALSKDHLLGCLWPGAFVTEASLSNLVAELRRVLGDDSRQPHLIRTVHSFGYAWCGTAWRVDQPPAAADHIYRLVWNERVVALENGENLLGRTREAVVWISHPLVSRRHARILVSPQSAILEDLGSKNGTLLNGRCLLEAAPLADLDEIVLGPARLTLQVFRAAIDSTETNIIV